MQKKIILRLGLVGVVATASGASALAVGCSGDDSTNTGPAADSGPADSTGFPDSQTGMDAAHDSNTADHDAAPPPPNAKLTLVHAAPGVPAFRVCFGLVNGTTTIVAPTYEPLPNNPANQGPFPYLGIFPGTGGTLADLGVNYSTIEIVGFIINADKIATHTSAETGEPQCSDLIGTDGTGPADAGPGALVLGTDYFKLPPIPKGTFTPGSSFLLVLEGCEPGNTTASAQAVCGAGYSSTAGNIALQIYQVDNSAPATATMGVQVLHASSAWDGVTGGELSQPIATTFGVTDRTVDGGGGNPPVATLINFGGGPTPDAAAPQTITAADYAGLAAYAISSAPDGGPLVLGVDPDGGTPILNVISAGLTFPQIQSLSGYATVADGGPADPLYLPGKNFVLVWVGDPSQPEFITGQGQPVTDGGASSFNTAYPHFLMFPTDPALPASN